MSNGVTARARSHTRVHKRQRLQRCMEDIARNTYISVQSITLANLITQTIQARQRLGLSIDWTQAGNSVPERWQLNYVRHELTEYETSLRVLRHTHAESNTDMQRAYYILRYRVLRKIGETYPHLCTACIREIMEMPTVQLRKLMPNEVQRINAAENGVWLT